VSEADVILRQTPAQLFPGDERAVAAKFKKLSLVWHPDLCHDPRAKDVFQYIVTAKAVALGKSDHNRLILERVRGGGKFSMDYVGHGKSDSGRHFVGTSTVAYLVPDSLRDLCEPAIRMKWVFPDTKMEKEMTKYLPNRVRHEETTDGTFLAYRREPEQMLLSDFIAFQKRRGELIDPRHVSWIISSLLNTCCYLEISRTAHCGLIPEYLLVSPECHSMHLTGPPLYATPWGHRPKAVPRAVLEAFPRMKSPGFKIESSVVDLAMIRKLAMSLLGHASTGAARRDTRLSDGIKSFLCSPAPESALKDYVAWEKARGKRAFTPFGATAREMYDALRN